MTDGSGCGVTIRNSAAGLDLSDMFQPILPVDLILRLPTAQLAPRLLETQSGGSELNFNSMLRGTQQAVGSTPEWAQVSARLSDAWSWLEAKD